MQEYIVVITSDAADIANSFIESCTFCNAAACQKHIESELQRLQSLHGSSVLCDAFVYKLCGETLA